MKKILSFFALLFAFAYAMEAQTSFKDMSRSERKMEVNRLLSVDINDMSLTTDQVVLLKKQMTEAGNYLQKQDMKMMYWGWGSAIGGVIVFPILFIAVIDAPVVAGVLTGVSLVGGMTVGSIPMFRNNHGQELLNKSRMMLVDINSQPLHLDIADGKQIGVGITPVSLMPQSGSFAFCPTLTLSF